MKILSAEQIRKADQFTIANEPIASIDLMERASQTFVDWFELNFDKSRKVFVFCGTGNNGGDGLAISRMLLKKEWDLTTITISHTGKSSQDFAINHERLTALCTIRNVESPKNLDFTIGEGDLVIDAIFGSGLSREVSGIHAEAIDFINNSGAGIVAVDIPSGLFSDKPSPKDVIIKADHVLCFQFPKLAFLLPENGEFVKQWHSTNIGLSEDFIQNQKSIYTYVDRNFIKKLYRPRSKFAHKTDFGRVLLIAGSWGKMGAATLCAKATIRSGAGLVTTHIPKCGYTIMQTAVPEAMVSTDILEEQITRFPNTQPFDTIGIGPGIGTLSKTRTMLLQLFSSYKKPMVIDADALNIIAQEKSLIRILPQRSILTPHPGEFRRMVGEWKDDFERLDLQIALSVKHKIYIVLKGAHTSISTPEGNVFFNSTGNPGMASGGSGDVLTGIITSLLGQKYSPKDAAILGVFLHGLAADIAIEFIGEESLCASDIIDYLPQAFMDLKGI